MSPTDFYIVAEAAKVLGRSKFTIRDRRWRERCQAIQWTRVVYLYPRAVVDAIAAGQREMVWREV